MLPGDAANLRIISKVSGVRAIAKFEPDFDSLHLIKTSAPGSMTDTIEAIFPNPVPAPHGCDMAQHCAGAGCDMAHSLYFGCVVYAQPIEIKNT